MNGNFIKEWLSSTDAGNALNIGDLVAGAQIGIWFKKIINVSNIEEQYSDESLEETENLPDPDIIAAVAARPDGPLAIGFAAETEHALEHARDKLARKGLDMILVNDVSDTRIGFDSNDNEVTLITAHGEQTIPLADKRLVSRAIIERIADLYEQTNSAR